MVLVGMTTILTSMLLMIRSTIRVGLAMMRLLLILLMSTVFKLS